MTTILDRIATFCRDEPDKPAIVTDGSTLSYGELGRAIERLAVGLPRAGVVLLFMPQGSAAVTAYLACMRAGCVPSFMPLPSSKQDPARYWASHETLLGLIRPVALLTDAKHREGLAEARLGVEVLSVENLGSAIAVPASPTQPLSEAIALLQHSSGTTALKKGVALSHRAVAEQVDAYASALAMTADDVVVTWLPLYHDMGLVACTIAPLMLGQTIVMLDPFAWSMRPVSLIEAISRHRGTLCWLPNFAFEHLVRTVRPKPGIHDLSSMRAFVNCSEPCKAETFARFTDHFAPVGLRETALQVCYAMAETVFAVSQTDLGRSARVVTLDEAALERGEVTPADEGRRILSCGRPVRGVRLKIQDEGGASVEGQVGEIVVACDFLLSRYYNRPDITAERLTPEGYRTNDLGFLYEGELFVLGRKDDLLIVHGRNYFAHEIEAIANAHPGLKPGRNVAVGLANAQTGSQDVVLIAESGEGADADLVRREVRERIQQDMGLELREVTIVPPGWLIKSTSGKIGQAENRRKYLEELNAATRQVRPAPAIPTPTAASRPILAIITPCFGHPELLQEALISAVNQVAAETYRIYIVNDGCKYQVTDDVGRHFARRHPGIVTYIKQPNGGLGKARNIAIEAVLRDEPSIEWFFFLDADNRLMPGFVETLFQRVREAPGYDWYYFSMPNLGGKEYFDNSGHYTLIENLASNACDAATLISRRIMDAGFRYYTDLPMGYEDWDLFLRSHASGFRGRHILNPGFLYRRRPESMVVGSNAARDMLMSEIRKRVGPAATYDGLIDEENAYLPRWAWLDAGTRRMSFASDPRQRGATISFEDGVRQLERARWEPRLHHFPSFLAILHPDFTDGSLAKIIHWLCWWVEGKLWGEVNVAAVRIVRETDDVFEVSSTVVEVLPVEPPPAILLCRTGFLRECTSRDDAFDWFVDHVRRGALGNKMLQIDLALPRASRAAPPPAVAVGTYIRASAAASEVTVRVLETLVRHLNAQRSAEPIGDRFDFRNVYHLDRRWAEQGLRDALRCGPVFGWVKRGRPSVGMILPFVDYGGVEKIALNSARVLTAHGFDVHLVVMRRNSCHIPPSLMDSIASISFLDDPAAGVWNGTPVYFGTNVSNFDEKGDTARLNGLFAHFDVIINAHSDELHGLMRQFRSRGVKTVSALQVIDKTQHGLTIGHPFRLVAYEHVYDRVLVPSHDLLDWCVAHGVPREKMLLVPNAPGLVAPDDVLAAARTERRTRDPRAPLRVLYIGRFDLQKGIDALEQIITRTPPHNGAFAWRVIGSTVVGGFDETIERVRAQVRIEPPRRDSAGLYEALSWADVIVLPSRFEGVPLTMLEAMSIGCVVIATAVGGVAEFLPDSVGFAVPPDGDVASAFVDILTRLSADRARLVQLSEAASAYGTQFTWERSLEPLVAFLRPAGGAPASRPAAPAL